MKMNYFFLGLLLISSTFAFANSAEKPINNKTKSGWKIDRELKFHFCYFRDNITPSAGLEADFRKAEPIGYAGEGLADITNINLSNFLSLGFDVPTRDHAQDYNFFLKFFHYPSWLSVRASSGRIFHGFLLDQTSGADSLESFLKKNENVLVKVGLIGKTSENFSKAKNPFPDLVLPVNKITTPEGITAPQEYFDSSIPFSSLYVLPAIKPKKGLSEKEKAVQSAKGVLAIHEELLDIYQKNFSEIHLSSNAEYRLFFVKNSCEGMDTRGCVFTVYGLPRQTLTFSNYRDLPMPQDPKNVFLTGLMLVFKTDYFSKDKKSGPPKNEKDLVDNFIRAQRQVLEIGSVISIKDK